MKKAVIILSVLALFAAVALAQDTTQTKPAPAPAEKAKSEVKAKTEQAGAAKTEGAQKAESAKTEGKAKATGAAKTETGKAKAKVGATPKMVTTADGLKYVDHVVGKGEEAVNGATVSVHYTGWLEEGGKKGKQFDTSRDKKEPLSFKLGNGEVIKGWEEGVAGMKVGGKRELFIPSELGYGAQGHPGGIPPNTPLIFEVELVKVTK